MTSEEYVEVYDYFSELTSPQADIEYQKIMNGTHPQIQNSTIAYLNVIAGIKNVAPHNGTKMYTHPDYKALEKMTAQGYKVLDVMGRDIISFNKQEHALICNQASVLLKEKWLEVNIDSSAIEQYLPEYVQKVEQEGGTINLKTILNTPALNRKLKDAMYNSVIQRIEPGDLSEAANTQGDGTNKLNITSASGTKYETTYTSDKKGGN